jgi:hypothetical protein
VGTRATVVVHATAQDLATGSGACEVEGGGVITAQAARRLGCSGRLQALLEDSSGSPIRLGRSRRDPSAQMVRLLRHRDRECTFPSCGARRFTHPHHIEWWSRGGGTDFENVILVCTLHHRLVHEHGWRVTRDSTDGIVRWFTPDGTRYRAGPGPPRPPEQPILGESVDSDPSPVGSWRPAGNESTGTLKGAGSLRHEFEGMALR